MLLLTVLAEEERAILVVLLRAKKKKEQVRSPLRWDLDEVHLRGITLDQKSMLPH
jgi:hypothetical protein